jgi:uncharacterized protein involved in exopolysaccharide biosynthesis
MSQRTARFVSLGIALAACVVPAFAGVQPVVPEPTTVLLIGGGLGAILAIRQLRKGKK